MTPTGLPAGDGHARAVALPSEWPEQLAKRWDVAVGLGHASPVVAGSRVIVEAFGSAGRASQIRPLPLEKMAARYARGELAATVH